MALLLGRNYRLTFCSVSILCFLERFDCSMVRCTVMFYGAAKNDSNGINTSHI